MKSTRPSSFRRAVSSALCLLLIYNPRAAHAVQITVEIVDDAASCTAMKLTESNMTVTCSNGDGSTDCTAGDTAAVTGNLLVHNTISDNPTVVLTPCISVLGKVMSSLCSDPIEAGYLCDWYNYGYNGGDCGATGSGFVISHSMTIPDEVAKIDELKEKAFGFLPGVGVHIAVSFANESCGYQQQQQQVAASEDAMSMAYVGVGAVFAIGVISLFERHRRRIRIAADFDDDDNNNKHGQNFVEMKDTLDIAVV
mmetsp:Transcript_16992/g.48803  ORF Transcript_16992/g.48803 Transcript_16992/m.48803 type:complete len:253 (+) Transcript_16992:152-910(+)